MEENTWNCLDKVDIVKICQYVTVLLNISF